MMIKNLYEVLSDQVAFTKYTRIRRVIQHPIRMIWPSIVQYGGRWLGMTDKKEIVTFFSESMNVMLPEVVSSFLYRYGFFEEGLTTFIIAHLKPGMVFFDIGPHYGYFTLLAAQLVGSEGAVRSFEPTPSTFQLLVENTRKHPQIIAYNIAIWSTQTTLEFNDYGISFSAFNSAYNPRIDNQYKENLQPQVHQVSAISIDSYIQETNCVPDFIKIDAESAEYDILIGMSELLRTNKPYISLEVGDMGIQGVAKSKQLIASLIDKGYNAFEYKEGRIVKHIIQEEYICNNIFFIHPDMDSNII